MIGQTKVEVDGDDNDDRRMKTANLVLNRFEFTICGRTVAKEKSLKK